MVANVCVGGALSTKYVRAGEAVICRRESGG